MSTETLDDLIDMVIDQIKQDIAEDDMSALAELLTFVPPENLRGYLPENQILKGQP
jgi:hypothetical protein